VIHVFDLIWKDTILLNRTLSMAKREVTCWLAVEYGDELMAIQNPGPPMKLHILGSQPGTGVEEEP
jgi:hypothetical protein